MADGYSGGSGKSKKGRTAGRGNPSPAKNRRVTYTDEEIMSWI